MNLTQRRRTRAVAVFATVAAAAVTLAVVNPSSAAVVQPPALDDPIPALIPFDRAQVQLKPVASGFASPEAAAVAPGHEHSLFVADQTGQIWDVSVDGHGQRLFADLSSRLVKLGLFGIAYDERGLLGLAFDPKFTENGRSYTDTSEPAAGPADFATPTPAVCRETPVAQRRSPTSSTGCRSTWAATTRVSSASGGSRTPGPRR